MLQLQARAAVTVSIEIKELLLSSARHVTEILSKWEEYLVTLMASAAVHVRPKKFECPRSGECFSAVVKDYLDGTFKGSQSEKVAMQTEILFEAAIF